MRSNDELAEAGLLELLQNAHDRDFLELGDVLDLGGRETVYLQPGELRLQPGEQIQIPPDPQVGMMAALQENDLVDTVKHLTVPVLGICVGMQLMASVGREHGDHAGLGWIPGEVTALAPADPALKIPHMGWNALEILKLEHPVLDGVDSGTYVYFVHGYELRPDSAEHLLARTEYGGPMAAAVGRDNLFGTQFHPEKSQTAGLKIIGNFLRWRP